ncbi:MAG: peptide-methionine (S)-S-oxide reductase MsrA [Candidatus Harrisonbacteria bacterium]|nr:peptide-methionine (S)-S-oxide reductase MsrA [Candidatus Harrisonbacteria bacterium]
MGKASFGAGCFWGVEDHFMKREGVLSTQVGYTGGTLKNPIYENLGDHTETLELEYNEKIISYKKLLEEFFKIHHSQLQQKRQYRSAIFYHSERQKELAQKAKALHPGALTAIEPASVFYRAEEYHQKYLQKHNSAVCE